MTDAKRLLAEATPLPWRWDRTMGGIRCDDHYIVTSQGWSGHEPKPDEALIVYAVNHLPDYLAAVEALERLERLVGPEFLFDTPAPATSLIGLACGDARAALARLRDEVPV